MRSKGALRPLDGAVIGIVVGAAVLLAISAVERGGEEGSKKSPTTLASQATTTTSFPRTTSSTFRLAVLTTAPPEQRGSSTGLGAPPTAVAPSSSLETRVAALRVDDEHVGGYDRDLFEHWSDADGDGCNTRSEVLTAESLDPVVKKENCTVLTGRWYSAYDGFDYTSASDVDIDHVVALAEAWGSGAWAWDSARREAFANDLNHEFVLIAVSDDSNQSKADKDPAQWMPSVRGYWCTYLRAWVDTKLVWELSVDQAEKASLVERARGC